MATERTFPVLVKIETGMKDEIDFVCQRLHMTRSEFIRQALREELVKQMRFLASVPEIVVTSRKTVNQNRTVVEGTLKQACEPVS